MKTYTKIKIAVSLIIIITLAICCGTNAIPRLDAITGDTLLKSGAPIAPEIIIIGIDDSSIEALGRFPWPRSTYAALLENLSTGGAAVIAMDILFTEESEEAEDEALMIAIAEAGNVVLPMQADIRVGQESRIGPDGLLLAHGVIYPIPQLKAQSLDFGHINTLPDEWDGFIRRGMGTFRSAANDTLILPWAEVVYRQYCQLTGLPLSEKAPLPFLSRPYIHYTGPPGTIPYYPLFAAIDPDIIDPAEFAGKIVLIGAYATALGVEDSFFTPASGSSRMYGVETHANALSNLLTGNLVVPLSPWLSSTVLLLLCGAVAVAFIRLRRTLTKLFVFMGAAGLAVAAWLLLFKNGLLFSIIYTLMALVILYLCDVVISYMQEFTEKRRITNTFGRYMARQVLDKIIRDGEDSLQLGGEERELTALFVDIRGFTPLSEVLQPTQVVEILNEYLTLATNAVFEYGGTLDKYIGDAVMALYNVPFEQENHVLYAVKSALAMQKNGVELNRKLEERYGRSVQFGVGVNTGRAVVGNIGSPTRMDYTAIGDMVNVAARLESTAKAGQILISEAVYEKLKDQVEAESLGGLKVKGRQGEVQTYLVKRLTVEE